MDYERFVLDHLPLVDEIVRFIARRHGLSADEAEELGAAARLKLVEDDYQVLRRFERRSSIRTYLTTVIQRHFLDERIARWGKWRPSALVRRLGPAAIELDRLIARDGRPVEEAIGLIASRPGAAVSREELEAIARQLPHRVPRRFVEDATLVEHVGEGSENGAIRGIDNPSMAHRIERGLQAALEKLGAQDRLILKMRFRDGLQISRIARLLGLPQKMLYRRIEGVMQTMRRELERCGISQAEVAAIVGQPAVELGPVINGDAPKNSPGRPSIQ